MDRSFCSANQEECRQSDLQIAQTLRAFQGMNLVGFPEMLDNFELQICSDISGQASDPVALLLNSFSSINNCVPLRPGEARVASQPINSNAEPRYTLRSLPQSPGGQERFQAVLDLNFVPTEGLSMAPDEFKQQIVRPCLETANLALLGPAGESLQLVLFEDIPDSDAVPRPQRSDIILSQTTARENAENWAINTQCNTIIHEVMHLLGLCDHYEETWIGTVIGPNGQRIEVNDETPVTELQMKTFKSNSPCRITSPSTEIDLMNDHVEAFDNCISPNFEYTVCACSPNNYSENQQQQYQQCIANLSQIPNGMNCPGKILTLRDYLTSVPVIGMSGSESYIMEVQPLSSPPRPACSLLRPNQFRKIVNAGCSLGTRLYNLCEAESTKQNTAECNPLAQSQCKGNWQD